MLMHLQAGMNQQHSQQDQHLMHHLSQNSQYPVQGYGHPDPNFMQDASYSQHMRVGSVPFHSGPDTHDEKRRKSSGVTATNDKELRELLLKNESRPLRDVAQEVIQKERTPMAEKTKQLFAMLW